jgi:hypothetical protein
MPTSSPMPGRLIRLTLVACMALPFALVLAAPAGAWNSDRVSKNVCVTTGGGRFVDIPEFDGETIDRRLLDDIEWMRRKFKIYIGDGYSTHKGHRIDGEHPLGLALDIVPDESIGGDWGDVNRLARWAEPRQDQPRGPFRWVGYWGDRDHGPRDHLHLSWDHSPTKPKHVARTVETRFCPGTKK